MKIDQEDFERKAQHIVDTVVKPQVERYEQAKAIEEAAAKWVFETNSHKWSNNDDTAGDNHGSFIAGAKWQAERMYSEEELRNAMNWMMTLYFEFYECPTTGRIDHYIQSLKQQEQ